MRKKDHISGFRIRNVFGAGFVILLLFIVWWITRAANAGEVLRTPDEVTPSSVRVDRVTLTSPGFVVLVPVKNKPHDMNDTYGRSPYLDAGTYTDFVVTFNYGDWKNTQDDPTELLLAVYHDTDHNRVFSVQADRPAMVWFRPLTKKVHLVLAPAEVIRCNQGFSDSFASAINTKRWEVSLQNIASGGLYQTAYGWSSLAFTKQMVTGDFEADVSLSQYETEHIGTNEYGAKLEFMVFSDTGRDFAINWAKDYYGSYFMPTYTSLIVPDPTRAHVAADAKPRLKIIRRGTQGSMYIDTGSGFQKLADAPGITDGAVSLGLVTMDGGYRTQQVRTTWRDFSLHCPE